MGSIANVQEKSAGLSLIAGSIAGGFEGFITYPTEYTKTQLQLQQKQSSPFQFISAAIKSKGIKSIYQGVTPLVVGNAAKAGIRFLVYDQIKLLFAQLDIKDYYKMVLSGATAGVCEALFVVTPSETIKTRLISDQNQRVPKYRGTIDCIKVSWREQGIKGVYRGLGATCLRQGANSAVRMSSYGTIKEELRLAGGFDKLPWYGVFIAGALAGTITVYTTMPFDVMKTKIQGTESGFSESMASIFRASGVGGFWKGATPRLLRLIFSGGIVFTVYESIIEIHNKLIT